MLACQQICAPHGHVNELSVASSLTLFSRPRVLAFCGFYMRSEMRRLFTILPSMLTLLYASKGPLFDSHPNTKVDPRGGAQLPSTQLSCGQGVYRMAYPVAGDGRRACRGIGKTHIM